MRRLLVILAVLAATVCALPAPSGAAATDSVLTTNGTYTGWMDCDVGSCAAELLLDGQFAFTGSRPRPLAEAIKTTAILRWQGPDDARSAYGTITSPRFEGTCEIRDQSIIVDPVAGTRHSRLAICTAVLDGGPSGGNLSFSFTSAPVSLASETTGRFFPPLEPFEYYPL